jgi:hypothetical protein
LGGCAGVGREDGQLSIAAQHADGSMASVPKDQALSLARLRASQCWFHTRALPLGKTCIRDEMEMKGGTELFL